MGSMGVDVVCVVRVYLLCVSILFGTYAEKMCLIALSVSRSLSFDSSATIILYLMEIYACMIRHTLYTHTSITLATSSSRCPHCVLVLHKNVNVFLLVNTFTCFIY